MTQNRTPEWERREYNRAYGLFGVSLLGSLLLFLWGIKAGLGVGGFGGVLEAATLIAIAFGVAVAGVDGIERYHEVTFLHRTNGELRKQITELKYGKTDRG